MGSEDVMCAFCAIQLPRHFVLDFDDNAMLRSIWDRADIRRATTLLRYNHESPYHNLVIAATEAERQGFWEGVDGLVPVPLHWWRHLRRGYNQAERLAQGMADVTGLPVVDLLRRTKYRKPQSQLRGAARIRNAEGIYEAAVPPEWQGKRLVLVDDVMTTGSTLANCAIALQKADKNAELCIFPLCYAG